MIAELSIIPIGKGTSMADEIAKVIDLVDKSGLKYRVNPMGTCIEGDLERVLELVKRCHQMAARDYPRVLTSIRIDDRRDAPDNMEQQIQAIESRLNHPVQK